MDEDKPRVPTALEEFMRLARERQRLFDQAFPVAALQKQFGATSRAFSELKSTIDLTFKAAQFSFPTAPLTIPQFNSAWLSAIKNATAIRSVHDQMFPSSTIALNNALTAQFQSAARSLQAFSGMLSAPSAMSQWQSQIRSTLEQLGPSLRAFEAAAMRLRVPDTEALILSVEHLQADALQALAEQAIESHQIVEALAQADTPEESTRLLAVLIAGLTAILNSLSENTVEEIRKAGIFWLFTFIMTIKALFPEQRSETFSPQQQHTFSEMRVELDTLQDMLGEFIAREEELNEAYISTLPRGALNRKTNIRQEPHREAPKLIICAPGTIISVRERHGRWTQIVFHDPLTNQLALGWVYGNCLTMLDWDSTDASNRDHMM